MWRAFLEWRERTLSDTRRDCLSKWALRVALAVMVSAWLASQVSGQAQADPAAVSIARLEERVLAAEHRADDLNRKLDNIDTKMWAGLVGIVALLAERALQFGKKGGR